MLKSLTLVIYKEMTFSFQNKIFFEKITEKHSSINNLDKISIITKLIDELLKFKRMKNYEQLSENLL